MLPSEAASQPCAGRMLVARPHPLRQQGIDGAGVMFFREESGDRSSNGLTDIRQHGQHGRRRPAHALQAAQPVSQGFGRGFTDMANPQRKQQARQ